MLYNKIEPAAYYAIGCSIGALLPDIDSPKSIISRFCRPISILIKHYCGHRGFTHAPILILLMVTILKSRIITASDLTYCLLYGLTCGIGIHLIQDIWTKGGIPVFYPFSKKKFSLSKMESGSMSNIPVTIVIVCCWMAVVHFRYNIFSEFQIHIPTYFGNSLEQILKASKVIFNSVLHTLHESITVRGKGSTL